MTAAGPSGTAFVDPTDGRFLWPGDMPARVRDFCAETGQPVPAGHADAAAGHPRIAGPPLRRRLRRAADRHGSAHRADPHRGRRRPQHAALPAHGGCQRSAGGGRAGRGHGHRQHRHPGHRGRRAAGTSARRASSSRAPSRPSPTSRRATGRRRAPGTQPCRPRVRRREARVDSGAARSLGRAPSARRVIAPGPRGRGGEGAIDEQGRDPRARLGRQLGRQGVRVHGRQQQGGGLRPRRVPRLPAGRHGHRGHPAGALGQRHDGHLLAGPLLRQGHQQRGPGLRGPRRGAAPRRPHGRSRPGLTLPRRRHLQRPRPLPGHAHGAQPTELHRGHPPPGREGRAAGHHPRPRVRQPLRVEPAQHDRADGRLHRRGRPAERRRARRLVPHEHRGERLPDAHRGRRRQDRLRPHRREPPRLPGLGARRLPAALRRPRGDRLRRAPSPSSRSRRRSWTRTSPRSCASGATSGPTAWTSPSRPARTSPPRWRPPPRADRGA